MPARPQGAATPPARLRQLITAPDILVMPGVFDGFSAKLVESMGFKAGFVTGSGVSESRWGWPDVGLMSKAESLDGVRALTQACDLPLLADADTGYGNAVNVFHVVREFERAGVGGIMIEDQTWPKRCGHMAGKDVIDADEMVQKIRAAVDARRDPDLVIEARTDAAGPIGIDEAVRRGRLYAEAGADLIFADALLSEDDIRRFCADVPAPVMVNRGFGIRRRATTPLVSARRLQELGAAVVIYPRLLTSAALAGMRRALDALRESLDAAEVADRPDLTVSFEELNGLMGLPEIYQLEKRYGGTGPAPAGPRRPA